MNMKQISASLLVLSLLPNIGNTITIVEDGTAKLTELTRGGVIAMNGKVEYNIIDFFAQNYETKPESFSDYPEGVTGMAFSFTMNESFPSGDVFKNMPHNPPEFGQQLWTEEFGTGSYSNLRWVYTDLEGKNRNNTTWFTYEKHKLIVPYRVQIPVYIDMSVINNEDFTNNTNIHDALERITKTMDSWSFKVSNLATNADGQHDESIGCATWLTFKLHGFVDKWGNGLDDKNDMKQLPDGITIVPTITQCGNHVAPIGKGIAGCATLGKRKIAISSEIINDDSIPSILLHEYGHSTGLDHLDEENNVMYRKTSSDFTNVNITQEQCKGIGKNKTFADYQLWRD